MTLGVFGETAQESEQEGEKSPLGKAVWFPFGVEGEKQTMKEKDPKPLWAVGICCCSMLRSEEEAVDRRRGVG